MKFPLPFFKNQNEANSVRLAFPSLTKDEGIFWSSIALVVLAGILLSWDAFVFWESRKTPSLLLPSLPAKERIRIQDIDRIIRMLDEREQAFQKILESSAPGTPLQQESL